MLFKKSSLLLFVALSFMSLRTTGQSLSLEPYCAPADFNGLTEALIPSCWSNKKPLNSSLKSDHEVCQCLRDPNRTKSDPIRLMMMAPSSYVSEEDMKKDDVAMFAENVKSLEDELRRDRDGMGFHAYTMSNDSSFTNAYLQDSPGTSDKSNSSPLANCLNGVNGVCSIDGGPPQKDKQIQKIISSFSVPRKVDQSLFQDKVFRPEQCVSAREYLASRQLPSEDILKTKIKETSLDNFKEDEWNHFELLKQYDEQMALSDSEKNRSKILALKAKLTFLNRNPMIKTFLASDTEMSPLENNKSIPDEKRAEIQNKLSGFKDSLVGKKKELLGILKGFVKKQDYMDEVSDYQDKLKNFFVKPDIGELMEIEFEKQAYKKMLGLKDQKNFKPRNDLSHKTVVDSFIRETGMDNPNDCNSEKAEIEKCVKVYSQYCLKLDNLMSRVMTAKGDPAFVDDLRESSINDLNTDFDTNAEFKEYNNEICQMKRSQSAGKKESIDFFTYRFRKCGPRISGECDDRPESIIALRDQFLKEYDEKKSLNKGNTKIANFDRFLTKRKLKPVRGIKNETNSNDRKKLGMGRALGDVAKSWGISSGESVRSSNVGKVNTNESPSLGGTPDQGAMNGESSNYQNPTPFAAKGQSTTFNGDKIEKMAENDRQNLLSEWENQYNDWKKSKGDTLNPKDSSTNAGLLEEISTLKALLAQQQTLSQEQYQLLNNAIASKNMKPISETDAESRPSVKRLPSGTSAAVFGSPLKDSLQDSFKSPASFNGSQASSVGSGSVASAPRISSFKPSIGSANASADSSPDSVIREQSKLINLRESSDGSIQIDSVSKAENGGANAISLDVSDNEYQNLEDKKSEIKLDQIKKRISQDHIAQLEKNGEITILLRNGEKPPFELKVQRKDNKLVYSLKDKNGNNQVPVKQRVYTQKALVLEVRPE
jgi:hypothetical protein